MAMRTTYGAWSGFLTYLDRYQPVSMGILLMIISQSPAVVKWKMVQERLIPGVRDLGFVET